jgi:hypothetical protein
MGTILKELKFKLLRWLLSGGIITFRLEHGAYGWFSHSWLWNGQLLLKTTETHSPELIHSWLEGRIPDSRLDFTFKIE